MLGRHTLRQIFVLSGLTLTSITDGFILGQMSGMVAGLQAKDSDMKLTENEISWIASSLHVTCVCGFALAAVVTEKFGRRRAITILTTPIVLNWIIMFYGRNWAVLVVSRLILGVCFGGVVSLGLLATAEYTSPTNRGFFLNMNVSLGPALGGTLAHVIGVLYHWRIVALIGIIPSVLSAVMPLFWVESPTWLASKGRFEECASAYKALHGDKHNSKELNLLIEFEKHKQSKITDNSQSFTVHIKKIVVAMNQKYFWNIALLTCVLHVYRVAAGKVLFYTFTLTILQDMIGSPNILMFTLIVDSFVILGSCLSCVLIIKMKMRTLLFSAGSLAIVLLVLLSACLYFKPENNVYYAWMACFLLSMYYITANAGPYSVLESLFAEIFPLELKTYCMFGFGTIGGLILFVSIQLALTMFSSMGYHGVFLLNACVGALCLGFFWFRLPETKGRTLQEIELHFKNYTFDALYNAEQNKELV